MNLDAVLLDPIGLVDFGDVFFTKQSQLDTIGHAVEMWKQANPLFAENLDRAIASNPNIPRLDWTHGFDVDISNLKNTICSVPNCLKCSKHGVITLIGNQPWKACLEHIEETNFI